MNDPRRYVITVDGRRHEVTVHPAAEAGTVEVTVDGQRRVVVDAADGDYLVRGGPEGAQVRVTLPGGPAPTVAATEGRAHVVAVASARQAAAADARAAGTASAGSGQITAPMPGRVVAVNVQPGDEVQADATIVIVEAMKMENEVKATVAGKVESVAVKAGDTVDAGQLLVALQA